MHRCPQCGASVAFCRLQARRYRWSRQGLLIDALCKRCGTAVTGRSWFPPLAVLAALLFLLVQLRVIDLRPVFAQFALQESIGEAGIFVGLLAAVALLACRIK